MTATDPDLLVDARTGVLTAVDRVSNPPEWPTSLTVAVGHVGDIGRDRWWFADRVSTGTAFGDPEQARRAAIGEAVERYCGNFVPAGLRRASAAELRGAGERHVEPGSLCLYSDSQYDDPGFPFQRFTDDLAVRWVRGTGLLTGRPVWVPASLVWVNYYHGPRADEPATNFIVYAGIAAGRDRADAERSALEEIVERDASQIWWHAGAPARPLALDGPRGAALSGSLAAASPDVLSYRVLHIPCVTGVPVIGVLVHDRELDVVLLGLAARPDPLAAAHKAAAEAVTLRSYAKGLLDPEGTIWQAVGSGVIDGSAFKPYRADRRYLDDYRPDFRDVIDLGCQTQVYLDPRTRPWVTHLLDADPVAQLDDVPGLDGEPRQTYLDRLVELGGEPVSVDLTTSDVAAAGLAVVRVVAPGLYSNAPSGFAFLGGQRLRHDPVRLGWRDTALAEDDIVLRPLPHT